MIDQIMLDNWKTHGSSKLSFTKGTNILIGQMGAGKSSVLDAISFALFGTFPSIQHRRVNTSELIRNRPEQKESASVTLNFTVDNDSYVVKRTLSRNGGAKATLEKNGNYVQSQPQRVNEEIEKALKIDYDLFSKAIYSEQNGLDYFLNLRPTERKNQIDELLGLDKFATAQDNVTSVINKIKDLAEEGERIAAGFDIDRIKEQLNALNEELKKFETERTKSEEDLKKFEIQRKKEEAELNVFREQRNKRVRIEQEIASSNSTIEILTRQINEIDAMSLGDSKELSAKADEIRKELEKAKADMQRAVETERKAQTQLSNTNADISKSRKENAEKAKLLEEQKKFDRKAIEKNITELKEKIDTHQKEMAHHAALKSEGSKWVTELEKHIQTCPVCERELEEKMRLRLVDEKSKSIKGLDAMINEIKASIDKEKVELETSNTSLNRLTIIEDKIKGYGDLEAALTKLEVSAKKAEEELASSKKGRDSLNEIMPKMSESLASLMQKREALSRKDAYAKQKKEASDAIAQKTDELKGIATDDSKIDALQKSFTETVGTVSRIKTTLEAQQKYEKEKREQIKDRNAEVSKIETIYKDVEKKRNVTENLSRFKTSLQETQSVLRSKLIDSINSIMHEVWPDIYPYGDYTSVMLDASPDDYVLMVKTNIHGENEWQNVEAIASGGERSIACLAMRIAFSLVLAPNLRWLILDEPTHNIDQQGLERFIKMFNEVLPKLIEQTFIITHDPILKQAYNSKVYMLTRNKDENRETVIEEV